MQFDVELSELAEKQYDSILSYISDVLRNPQAIESIMDDFDDVIETLEKMAVKSLLKVYTMSCRSMKIQLCKMFMGSTYRVD